MKRQWKSDSEDMVTVSPVKAAQEQAVDDGDRPVEDSVYFVPSRREDLDDGVGEEDEDEGDDAVGGLAGVPEGDGQHDVCNRRTGSGGQVGHCHPQELDPSEDGPAKLF